MYYQANKIASKTRTTTPSLTDQSQADSTDLNIILKNHKFNAPALGRGAAEAPRYEDYSNLPTDYREAIELARQMEATKKQLPPQLRTLPTDQLLNLTPEQLAKILTPQQPTPKPAEEEKK